MRKLLILAVAFTTAYLPLAGGADPPRLRTRQPASAKAIRMPSELTRYEGSTPADLSLLTLLPVGARKRFLSALVWGSNGVGGFNPDDLTQYLTDTQIRQVLALFASESYASGLHGRTVTLTAAQRAAPETPLERKFDRVYFARLDARHDDSPADPVALYDRLLAPYQNRQRLAALDDSDAILLFRAARNAASDSPQSRYLDNLRLDLAELHRRGSATPSRVVAVHEQLVAARHFAEADALAKQYPAARIAPLPPLRRAVDFPVGEPTVLVMEPDRKSMRHQPIDMRAPLRIVVVSGCHFSEDTVRAVRADPRLDGVFREHAIWLANENESPEDVLAWNRAFPDQPMVVAWKDSEWSMLDSWSMPTFYVFRDGKLIEQWKGWPGSTDEIHRHLAADRVLP